MKAINYSKGTVKELLTDVTVANIIVFGLLFLSAVALAPLVLRFLL